MACVDVCSLALQLMVRQRGFGTEEPAVVVDKDTPQGVILQVNEGAWREGVRPGQRYAAALGLTAKLRAGVVSNEEIDKGVAEITEILLLSSPRVEPSREHLGVFWVDASGLGLLYKDLLEWASELCRRVCDAAFVSTVVVGFTRFGAYAVARSRRGILVFREPHAEWQQARQVRIERLGVAPKVRDQLALLGVHTIGELVGLPSAGLRQRYGAAVHRWREFAVDAVSVPLQAVVPEEAVLTTVLFDDPERNHLRLLFVIKRDLHPLLATLVERAQVLAALELHFQPRDGDSFTEVVRPADPTCDERVLVDLVRLRLESIKLRSGVAELAIVAKGVKGSAAQLALFARLECSRDIDAARRALARVRAEFGEGAVTFVESRRGHLPEARFRLVPWHRNILHSGLSSPDPAPVALQSKSLVRRVLRHPRFLSGNASGRHPDGWFVAGVEHGAVVRSLGPYLVNGGWWSREVERAYHYLELASGEIIWAFWDVKRRAWYQHGGVE
jgi:protein ImuB